MMTKREIQQYTNASTDDQRSFQRWLGVSAVVGSIFAGVVIAIAVAASDPGPREASAGMARPAGFSATDTTAALSAYELMSRLAPDQLPVEQVSEPF
jgi:hypothetical protein